MPASTPSPQPSFIARTPSFWQVQLLGWIGFSAGMLPVKQIIYDSLSASLLVTLYQLPLSLVLTGVLRLFYRRVQPTVHSFWRVATVVVLGCTLTSGIDLLISTPLNNAVGATGPANITEPGLFIFRATVYLVWSLGYFLIKAQLDSRKQAFQFAVADEKLRLETLRYQLNPQFLANSLAVISDEIDQDPSAARAMTTRLINFYQATLRQTEQNAPATLGDELELLRAYLGIESLRLGTALTVNYRVNDALLTLPLPPLLLLPLAEKAVQYGRTIFPQPIVIHVTAQPTGDGHALIEVAHTGRLSSTTQIAENSGSDLINLRVRLERHYPGRHRFELTQDSTRVRATLYLPLPA